jgi:hypothetical protein
MSRYLGGENASHRQTPYPQESTIDADSMVILSKTAQKKCHKKTLISQGFLFCDCVVEMGGVEPPSKIGELRASTRVVSRLL